MWGNQAAHASVAGVLPGPRFWGGGIVDACELLVDHRVDNPLYDPGRGTRLPQRCRLAVFGSCGHISVRIRHYPTLFGTSRFVSRKNLASGQTQQNFSFIQAAKGKRSGEVRRKGTPLELDRAPWELEGISRRGWYYRQSGKDAGPQGRVAPWEAEGLSRATWYRRGNRLR